MSLTRKDLLFWLATVVIILGALAVAQLRRHAISDHRTMFLLGLIGGLLVFRVGVQLIWGGMRSRQRPRLWIGAEISLAGLLLVYLGLFPH
ncbi:MAG TPA: hypothetical protein VJT32_01020 [bacterium]|nr:hypothetical protein [bacterium]